MKIILLGFLTAFLSLSVYAHESEIQIREVPIKKSAFGGGIGFANSAKPSAEYNAAKEVASLCSSMEGVLKKNSLKVMEAVCGDVYDFQGFPSRDCTAEATAVCLVVIQ